MLNTLAVYLCIRWSPFDCSVVILSTETYNTAMEAAGIPGNHRQQFTDRGTTVAETLRPDHGGTRRIHF